ncbi:hypothetical protein ACWZQY_024025 [Priestia megaterium]
MITHANKVNRKTSEFMLDEGKRNVGFNLFEAIMESIDDAFDASVEKGILKIGNEVRIYI